MAPSLVISMMLDEVQLLDMTGAAEAGCVIIFSFEFGAVHLYLFPFPSLRDITLLCAHVRQHQMGIFSS